MSQLRPDIVASLNRHYLSGGTAPQRGLGDLINEALAGLEIQQNEQIQLYQDLAVTVRTLLPKVAIYDQVLPILSDYSQFREANAQTKQQLQDFMKYFQKQRLDTNCNQIAALMQAVDALSAKMDKVFEALKGFASKLDTDAAEEAIAVPGSQLDTDYRTVVDDNLA